MTIYINGRFLTQPMTGVERYAYNICKALAALGQPFTVVCPKAPIHSDYDVSALHIVHSGSSASCRFSSSARKTIWCSASRA